MRFAIMECVVTPGGHEIDFDRLLVEELTALGHTVEFYVPEGHEFKWNYGVKVTHIKGAGVSYKGTHGLKKLVLAARRELHRQRWYRAMYDYARKGAFDALIFPSATYRYLRALKLSPLKNSSVPVLFLIHGATPLEAQKLVREAQAFKDLPNIRVGIQTFAAEKLGIKLPHARVYGPPNYLPRDIDAEAVREGREPLVFAPLGRNDAQPEPVGDRDTLRLGFFGQYRREKNVEAFLEAFEKCQFARPVKLIVQGSTQTPEDAADFSRIIKKYEGQPHLEFWHRPLIGIDWQKGLASCDALVMPYGNDRYLYHTSALLSNAMGYKKSVIVADNVNPEVLKVYHMGMSFPNGDMEALRACIENFVNSYEQEKVAYAEALSRAYEDFSPRRLAESVAELAR